MKIYLMSPRGRHWGHHFQIIRAEDAVEAKKLCTIYHNVDAELLSEEGPAAILWEHESVPDSY